MVDKIREIAEKLQRAKTYDELMEVWEEYNKLIKSRKIEINKKDSEWLSRIFENRMEEIKKIDTERAWSQYESEKLMKEIKADVKDFLKNIGFWYDRAKDDPEGLKKILWEISNYLYSGKPIPREEIKKIKKWIKIIESRISELERQEKEIPHEDLREYDEIWGEKTGKRYRVASFFSKFLPTILPYNLIPAIFGIIVSFLFYLIFKNFLLVGAGVLFSLSLLFSREGPGGTVKALFEGAAFLLASIGIYPFNKLLGFIILFIGYAFMRPMYTEEPYEVMSALIKMFFSLIIAGMIFLIAGGVNNLQISPGLFLITLGALFVLPHRKEDEKTKIFVVLGKDIKKTHVNSFSFWALTLGIFLVSINLIFDKEYIIRGLLFSVIGAITLFSVRSFPPEYRGEATFPLLIILLLTVSTAYPAILGEALFGPVWWAKIETTVTPMVEPIKTAFSQVSEGISDITLMFTCPQCYYEKKMREQQAQAISEGTIKAVEVYKQEWIPSDYIIPEEPVDATITLENQGEFDAKKVTLYIEDPEIRISGDWKKIEEVKISSIEGCERSENSCVIGDMNKNDKREVMITYDLTNAEINGESLATCKCSENDNEGRDVCNQECVDDKGNEGYVYYKYGDYPIKFPIKYSFIYNTTAKLENIEAISEDLWKEGEYPEEKLSQYLGGPVKVAISIRPYPLIFDKERRIIFKISNQGDGRVIGSKLYTKIKFYIPNEFLFQLDKDKDGTPFASQRGMKCEHFESSEIGGYKKIECSLTRDLYSVTQTDKPSEASVTVRIKVNNPKVVNKKSYTIFGEVKYGYEKEIENTLTIIPSPP